MQCSVMYIAVRCGWYSQNASFFSLSPCVRVAVWGRWAVLLNDVAAAVADDLHMCACTLVVLVCGLSAAR
jgi:uncharacterized membrane protein